MQLPRIIANNQVTSGLLLIIVVIASALLFGIGEDDAQKTDTVPASTSTVERVDLIKSGPSTQTVTTSGEVKARLQATVAAESSGVISSVPSSIGERVTKGEVLAIFSNADQQASLRQAEANLAAQKAALAELQAGARPAELQNTEISVETAETNLAEAREAYLNTDLQAYLDDGNDQYSRGSLAQPTLSGTYDSDEEGEYRIDLYSSGANSGYSFRYTGLETGVGTVSTATPQRLGNRGLYIQFPENFATNHDVRWVVPVPNTRSGQHIQAKSNLERAKQSLRQARNNSDISAAGARSEQIDAQRAQVESAEAGVAAAEAQLEKTVVRAPFSATVLSLSATPGEYKSPGQAIAKLLDENSLEIRTYVSSENAKNISEGDTAKVEGGYQAEVVGVAPAIDSETGSVELRLRLPQAADLVSGSYVDVTFPLSGVSQESSETVLPLSAVGTNSSGSYVYVVDESGTAQQLQVETGSVTGGEILVTSDISDQKVIKDISGISAGQVVTAGNENNSDE